MQLQSRNVIMRLFQFSLGPWFFFGFFCLSDVENNIPQGLLLGEHSKYLDVFDTECL